MQSETACFCKVSIIMPCYNQGQYIEDAINSVRSQTHQNWECIIVDDGSIDGSYEITKKIIGNDNRFILLKQENSGVCIARNIAAEKASGEFLLPLDADDKLAPTYIEKALSVFNTNQDCKLVYSDLKFFGLRNEIWLLPEYNYDSLLWKNQIVVTALFRKSDFLQVGGYNPNMKDGCEDWDFYLSFLKPNDVVIKIPEILFFYRQKKALSRNMKACNNINMVRNQIVINHIDRYLPFLPNIITYRTNSDAWDNAHISKLYKFCYSIIIILRRIRTPFKWLKKRINILLKKYIVIL